MTPRKALPALCLLALAALAGCMEPTTPWEPAPPQWPASHGLAPAATVARSRVAADTTAALVLLLVVLPFGGVAAFSLFGWLQHRRYAAAERAFDPRAPLVNGHAMIVGQVELDEGAAGPAIEVVIRQRGRDWRGKHGWHHQWQETTREVRVRPFWVRLFSGQRVRVEPDERVVLRDDLSRVVRTSRLDRARVAELTPGETVHVTGSLFAAHAPAMGAAYRAAAQEPVLRPSRLAPMVVSTERPGETSSARARFYRAWLIGAALAGLALPAAVFPTVAVLALTGRTVSAQPDATRHWQRYHKPKNSPGYYVQHYGLRSARAERDRTRVLTDECSVEAWSCVAAGECPEVRYTVSALSDEWVQIGDGPQLTTGRAVALGLAAFVLMLAFPLSVLGSRPWYFRRGVNDSGAGQLPDFVAPSSGGFSPR